MILNSLTAISPVDGRYRNKISSLGNYFSEYALIKYRVLAEIEYFIALSEIPIEQLNKIPKSIYSELRNIYNDFSTSDAGRVKEIEKTTNHDVKAVEYFIKEKFEKLNISGYKEFIHFGLTSQDINNTATPLSIKDAIEKEYIPLFNKLKNLLSEMAKDWSGISMLARTHGQPASPTRLGKEVMVFIQRLEVQIKLLKKIPYAAKFGGATGNFNAHYVAYPEIDWNKFAVNYVENILGLKRSYPTTQIEHYDHLAALFDNLKRINTILIDLSRDFWTYISMDYLKQKIKKGEIGSSAMPHKVNPIDFENAEGNLGIANSFFEHLSAKLPVSRLQRDLTDSTVLRNVGVPVAHSMIALKSLIAGLNKVVVNESKINADLEENWVVIAEAIQTILRREGYPNPYEILLNLTRLNKKIGKQEFIEFIDSIDVNDSVKKELKLITPFNYTGL